MRGSKNKFMLSDHRKKENDMEALAPYPKPSKQQDQLVHRVELFANGIKIISRGVGYIFYPVTFFPRQIKKKITKRKWKARAQAVPKKELIPPQQNEIYVASSTQAMDQNFFYVLKDERLWFKPIAAPKESTWLLFGPDGLPPNGTKLTAISSDGVNLVAVGKEKIVNYVHTDRINVVVTDDGWKIEDIQLDWTDRWVAIPLINKIVGLIQGKHLTLPKDCIAFAISQKGPEAAYYTDMNGKKQPEFLVGVTTLYALTKDGRIFFADPWLASGFWNEITAPEDGKFIAENMAAAASTIFLIRRDETGKPCMYTRFADFDSISSNPLLPATYNPDNRVPLVRRLPGEDWIKQPDIPLEGRARVTSQIAVLQTGRGQNNRQLRVEGTNADGEPGYYFKGIYETQWHFEITPDQTLNFKSIPDLRQAPPPPVTRSGEISTKKRKTVLKDVELKKFLRHGLNERGLHTAVELTLNNGRKLTLPLYARRGLAQLLGQRTNSPYWKLMLPKQYELDNDPQVQSALNLIFNRRKKISVSVHEFENGDIEISKHCKFKFKFKATGQKNFVSPQDRIRTHSHVKFPTSNVQTSNVTPESKNDVVGKITLYHSSSNTNRFYPSRSCNLLTANNFSSNRSTIDSQQSSQLQRRT